MSLSIDVAMLVGFACEGILWGIYTTLFIVALILLWHRSKRGIKNHYITVASVMLYVMCTTHFALNFNHFYTALGSTGVSGYATETKPLIGADFLVSVCDLMGDFILLYRCWVLWGQSYWVIALPFMTAVAGFACIGRVVRIVVTQTPTSSTPDPSLVPLDIAGYALPLCTNAMATGLIAYRIWSMSVLNDGQATLQSSARLAKNAMTIIVESGLLYLVTQLVFVVLNGTGNTSEAILVAMAVQIYGISPTLIIIRVGLGIAVESSGADVNTPIIWAVNHISDSTTTQNPDEIVESAKKEGFEPTINVIDIA
ncbi:hypothetical protein BD311DRAFT_726926 [Dichomitus squalens]|uniref:RTA1 like protein-domain-containing protein n=1 Tax=Dichomitus squalens TaxID=114155 RepID=A0A4V2JZP6_9APHY|nr:hypothetical protein BD311DRAFT_726926 [Dichomitus squalens]